MLLAPGVLLRLTAARRGARELRKRDEGTVGGWLDLVNVRQAATAGHLATVDLRRVFFLQLEVLGSTMGTRDELAELLSLCVSRNLRPMIDSTYPLAGARAAVERLESGEVFGKLVLDHTH